MTTTEIVAESFAQFSGDEQYLKKNILVNEDQGKLETEPLFKVFSY